MITYEIPCLLGLEKLVADEVKRLGLQDVRAENGRILCRGSWADCARLNINLRCGARVIALLGQFPAQRSCFRASAPSRGRNSCRRTPPSR